MKLELNQIKNILKKLYNFQLKYGHSQWKWCKWAKLKISASNPPLAQHSTIWLISLNQHSNQTTTIHISLSDILMSTQKCLGKNLLFFPFLSVGPSVWHRLPHTLPPLWFVFTSKSSVQKLNHGMCLCVPEFPFLSNRSLWTHSNLI